MKSQIASMKQAKDYVIGLPEQLDDFLDEAYRKALDQLLQTFDQFFNVVASLNIRAAENQPVSSSEATRIGDHGFVLLLRLIDLMERLDLPHKRKEVEQLSVIFARWIIRYGGTINHPEPVVNAFAQLANLLQDKRSLTDLSELMEQVIDACSTQIKQDLDKSDALRPWRLLHINRGIVATRTHDLDIMKRAFDEMLAYLPDEATGFFSKGMKEMETQDYPQHVRHLMASYFSKKPPISLH